METWLILAIIPSICWALGMVLDNPIRNHYIKDNIVTTILISLVRCVSIIAILFFIDLNFPSIPVVLQMLAAGALWVVGILAYYQGIKTQAPSTVSLLLQTTPLPAFFFAYLLLGEQLTSSQGLGFVLIFLAGMLMSFKKSTSATKISSGALFIIFAGIVWALTDVLFKILEPQFASTLQAALTFMLGNFLTALLFFLLPKYFKKTLETIKTLPRKAWQYMFVSEIFSIAGDISFAYAIVLGKVSLVSVMIGIQPLFALLIGLILVKFIPDIHPEKLDRQTLITKSISLTLILIGLIYIQ